MHYSSTKQQLKPIWLHCLKDIFEEAEKRHQNEIEISARDLQHMAKEKFPFYEYNKYRSTCWTMHKIMEVGKDEEIGGKFDSSTYTIKYQLPRTKQIENATIPDIEKISYSSNRASKKISKNLANKIIDIKQNDINEIVMSYYNQMSPEHRYTSFDYCYNYFYTSSDLTKDMEKSCLQLCFYLASWGMLRNSDLLQKSSKYYQKLIEYISSLDKDNWKIDVDKYNNVTLLEQLLDLYSNIKIILNGTDTLTSKVILGVFGSIPAFDRYFKNTFNVTSFNKKALIRINDFYNENKMVIDELAKKILVKNFDTEIETKINYPKAKIIDMYGFTKGLLMEMDKNKRLINGKTKP